jgi:hypothetical protein
MTQPTTRVQMVAAIEDAKRSVETGSNSAAGQLDWCLALARALPDAEQPCSQAHEPTATMVEASNEAARNFSSGSVSDWTRESYREMERARVAKEKP